MIASNSHSLCIGQQHGGHNDLVGAKHLSAKTSPITALNGECFAPTMSGMLLTITNSHSL
jgi:hypothetical protein